MGLDGVELVIATEEQFGIKLSDAEAERCRTPGQLVDLVLSKLRLRDDAPCVHQRAFHLLRRGLIQVSGAERRSIRLDTKLIAGSRHRHTPEFWHALRDAVGARSWPRLERPRWVVGLLWLVFFGTCAALTWWTSLAAVAVVGGFLMVVVGNRVTKSCGTTIPAGCATVRGLIPHVTSSPMVSWSREQVAPRVRNLVEDILSLSPGQYREDADFVKDLGLD